MRSDQLHRADVRHELEERGFTALRAVFSPAECAEMRRLLDAHHTAVGAPALLDFGLGIHPLVDQVPEMAVFYRHPAIQATAQEILGGPVVLAHTGARLADERSVGVLNWHHHYGWPVGGLARRRRLERLLVGVYVDGSTPESGCLVALPRRMNDPLDPPLPGLQCDWPGQVEVHAPPGSIVFFDTALWHGARRGTRPGRRRLWGAHIQRADDPREHLEDNCRGFAW